MRFKKVTYFIYFGFKRYFFKTKIIRSIINCNFGINEIANAIKQSQNLNNFESPLAFGEGKSDQLFLDIIKDNSFWKIPCQKQFRDQKLAN